MPPFPLSASQIGVDSSAALLKWRGEDGKARSDLRSFASQGTARLRLFVCGSAKLFAFALHNGMATVQGGDTNWTNAKAAKAAQVSKSQTASALAGLASTLGRTTATARQIPKSVDYRNARRREQLARFGAIIGVCRCRALLSVVTGTVLRCDGHCSP